MAMFYPTQKVSNHLLATCGIFPICSEGSSINTVSVSLILIFVSCANFSNPKMISYEGEKHQRGEGRNRGGF